MNLTIGIVGLPNAGKSTLFNALLKRQMAYVANYPFATIEPNIGVVPVPDGRLMKLAEITQQEEHMDALPPIKPATVEFVDIAGLVKGASEGQGLGNKFLSHIREVTIICHVIRSFQDPDIVHVAGKVVVYEDKQTVETELILADLQTLNKQLEPRGAPDKVVQARWKIIEKLKQGLNAGALAQEWVTDPQEKELIRDLHLLTMKPVIYVLNVGEKDFGKVSDERARELDDQEESFKESAEVVWISAKIESEVASLPETEQKEYLASMGLKESGLERLIKSAYRKLGLISFLTTGVIESRAWTIEEGTKAPHAAGVIHTDFEKKFIKADVMPFDDFIEVGGWKKAREAGKVHSEGRDYIMRDGDVVEFKIGT